MARGVGLGNPQWRSPQHKLNIQSMVVDLFRSDVSGATLAE
jgi:hypothetical protein